MSVFLPTGGDVYHPSQWLSAVGIVALIFLGFYAVVELLGDYMARHIS